MFIYRIDVLQKLKESGYNTNRLRKEKMLSENAIQDIRNGKIIGIKSLHNICMMLNCQPNAIIKYLPEKDYS